MRSKALRGGEKRVELEQAHKGELEAIVIKV